MRTTIKQDEALVRLLDFARSHDVEVDRVTDFNITYEPESRPGRGHDIQVHYVDGDHAVYSRIDVYGNGSGGQIARLDWIHDGTDDAADDCEFCPDNDDLEDQP